MDTQTLPVVVPAFPEVHVPVWAWALAAFAVVAACFIMLENGVVLSNAAETLHEFFHHGRHFSGVPCH